MRTVTVHWCFEIVGLTQHRSVGLLPVQQANDLFTFYIFIYYAKAARHWRKRNHKSINTHSINHTQNTHNTHKMREWKMPDRENAVQLVSIWVMQLQLSDNWHTLVSGNAYLSAHYIRHNTPNKTVKNRFKKPAVNKNVKTFYIDHWTVIFITCYFVNILTFWRVDIKCGNGKCGSTVKKARVENSALKNAGPKLRDKKCGTDPVFPEKYRMCVRCCNYRERLHFDAHNCVKSRVY